MLRCDFENSLYHWRGSNKDDKACNVIRKTCLEGTMNRRTKYIVWLVDAILFM